MKEIDIANGESGLSARLKLNRNFGKSGEYSAGQAYAVDEITAHEGVFISAFRRVQGNNLTSRHYIGVPQAALQIMQALQAAVMQTHTP
ncbi:Uncharacterised protein [Candidatus Venteria ishoeyi]|uniref:Uncharacterized protein n=2 Tax=Candidatus Venteria ishoeyi TaxID=1899563 RepID=A0A1H6F898_9GAMM|nr:Uncharacterised protein [Candidatus Venteria ishoeyi]